jgi:hypothetical protein
MISFRGADYVKHASIFVFSEKSFTSRTNTAPNIFRLGPYLKTHRRHFLQQSDYTLCLSFENNEWRFGRYDDVFQRSNHQQGVYRKFNLPASERPKILRLLAEYTEVTQLELDLGDKGILRFEATFQSSLGDKVCLDVRAVAVA